MNYGSELDKFGFTKLEKEWLESAKNHHSYFLVELTEYNTIKKVYLMDASKAQELTEEDKETFNFERRLKDSGVEKVKLNRRAFMKFWNKKLIVSLSGLSGIEQVKHRRYSKLYKCRPFGWVLDEIEG